MAKIVFWSLENKVSSNTSTAIAVSCLAGLTHKATSILMHGYLNNAKIESAFNPYEELKASGALDNASVGLGALTRLSLSNKLSAESIRNYAKPVLKDRLDILYGVNVKELDQYDETTRNLAYIINKANEIYDMVFMDIPKTAQAQYIKDIIADADVVVCTVNQEIIDLDYYFNNIEKEPALKNKNVIMVVGNHENISKYNAANIKRKYRLKDNLYVLPHNRIFLDACDDGNVLDFFYKNMNAEKDDYNGEFIAETGHIVERIIELAKLKDI